MDVKIVDLLPKYTSEIAAIETHEWGGSKFDGLVANRIVKVALDNNHVIGVAYGMLKGDLFVLDTIIVQDQYRGCGSVGTRLIDSIIETVTDIGAKNCIAECIGKNKIVATMKRLGFKEIVRVQGYWSAGCDSCKLCGGKCKCTCVLFIKELSAG